MLFAGLVSAASIPAFQAGGAGSNPVSRSTWEPSSNFVYLYIIDVNEITKSKWCITSKRAFVALESNLGCMALEIRYE